MINEYVHEGQTHQLRHRWDVAKLVKDAGVGIELGTAAGGFSYQVLTNTNLEFLYTVDRYQEKHHTINEYQTALKRLQIYRTRSTILRMNFSEALVLFPDEYFDFVYVDGFAHTGEDNGEAFRDWWPKLKPGGIFAGDDYHENWPLVVDNLNCFSRQVDRSINVIACEPIDGDTYSQYPTWFMVK